MYALVGSFLSGLCGVIVGNKMKAKTERERLQKEALSQRAAYRQDWVNALRQEMAGFYAIVTQHNGSDQDCQKYADALSLHKAMILLYLNPKEPVYAEIKTVMENLRPNASPSGSQSTQKTFAPAQNELGIAEFLRLSQGILKEEWERIKRELAGKSDDKAPQNV